MIDFDRYREQLGRRILLAAMGASGAACSSGGEPSVATGTEMQTAAIATESATASAVVQSSPPDAGTLAASADPVATPPPDPPAPRTNVCGKAGSTQRCFEPFAAMRSTGTGEPAPKPPPAEYDKNGCLPASQVTNGCCNGAAGGPRFASAKCCYDFCAGQPCCGRPFVVAGEARRAELERGGGWATPGIETCDRSNPAIANAWLADARMEHASIASFARFTLDLLAHGAPADLVRGSGEAMLDEVRHAELCFAVAARFGAGPWVPGPLPVDGALARSTLRDLVTSVVVEGCVGETLAALAAARQREGAIDPFVRDVLEQIADDEARHAELAWRCLRWALDTGEDELQAVAAEAFELVLSGPISSAGSGEAALDIDPEIWRAAGRLTAEEHGRVMSDGIERVLRPCAEKLLG